MDRIVAEGKYLRFIDRNTWEFVERTNASAIVMILAIVDDAILLTEQFRPSLGKMIIEMPAGLVGDEKEFANESLESAANRELLEETGYSASEMEFIIAGPLSAGLSNEVIQLYLAKGLKKVNNGGGVAGENITVHKVPLEKVDSWIADTQKRGCLVDPKVLLGAYYGMSRRQK